MYRISFVACYFLTICPCLGTLLTIPSNSLSTLDVPLWTKHICSQSPIGWLQFFCVRGWSLRHRWRGGLHRSPPDSRLLRHAWELSHSCFCPVDKGIGSCFSCLAVLVVCHNSDALSFLKKCDTYPNGDFNEDDCPT